MNAVQLPLSHEKKVRQREVVKKKKETIEYDGDMLEQREKATRHLLSVLFYLIFTPKQRICSIYSYYVYGFDRCHPPHIFGVPSCSRIAGCAIIIRLCSSSWRTSFLQRFFLSTHDRSTLLPTSFLCRWPPSAASLRNSRLEVPEQYTKIQLGLQYYPMR